MAAHPFHTGEWEFQSFYLWSQRLEIVNLIDAWEFNIRQKISREIFQSGLPVMANSDFHHESHFKSWKSSFEDVSSLETIFDQIHQRNVDFFFEREIRVS